MTQREIDAAIAAMTETVLEDGVPADDVLQESEIERLARAALAAAEQARMDQIEETMG